MSQKKNLGSGPKTTNRDTLFLHSPTSHVSIGPPRVTDKMIEALVLGGEPLMRYLDKSNRATLEEYKRRLQLFVASLDSKYRPPRIENLAKRPMAPWKKPGTFRRLWAS